MAVADPQRRRAELARALDATRTRIAEACAQADRDPQSVTLVVVTKTWPASDIRLLAELGVVDVGENRSAELAEKRGACADLNLRWHFIGQIQSRKAAEVAREADVVHSVDRSVLIPRLGRARCAPDAGGSRPADLECLIQVSLDPDPAPGRGGASEQEVAGLAEMITAEPGLRLRGVMGVAPLGGDAREAFARLRRIHESLRERYPQATWMSAGMSDDLTEAVACGATHLRIGSAVLGSRPDLGVPSMR